jgi:hypothetical protein
MAFFEVGGMPSFKSLFKFAGAAQTVQGIWQWMWAIAPVGYGVMTAWFGVTSGQTWMWVSVAAAAGVAFVFMSFFFASVMSERKNPEYKIKLICPHFGVDFLTSKPNSARRIKKAQLGCQIRNDATFPISVIVQSATSELESNQPPRTKYPKAASLIGAGGQLPTPNFWARVLRFQARVSRIV